MAPSPRIPQADAGLEALIGDLATAGAFGWAFDHVTWTNIAEIVFRRGDRRLNAFVAPAAVETGCYRTTAHFKVGYRGSAPDADGLRLLESIADRLRMLESRLAPGDAVPWPGRSGAPEGLTVSDGVLELRVTSRCNERCAFCNSADWVENRMDAAGAVDRALEAAPSLAVHTVHFTGGEPTLVRELPDWVVAAKRAGLRVVIQTNALGMDSDGFWDAFRDEAGRTWMPDQLFVSFHTRHAARVKALTGVGGTFRRKVAGVLRALAHGVDVSLNFVIQQANLDEVGEFPAFVAETFGTSVALVLSVVAPTGRSADRPDLWPSMEDLAPRLEEALDEAQAVGIAASVPEACGVPMCVLPTHRRFFEASRRTVPVTALAQDRVKAPSCAACAVNSQCLGVWRRYAETRGLAGFVPIPAEGG